jgi:hypothetical protein
VKEIAQGRRSSWRSSRGEGGARGGARAGKNGEEELVWGRRLKRPELRGGRRERRRERE